MIESDRYWKQFVEAVGLPELESDERFSSAIPRFQNREDLVRLLDERFASRTLEEWRKTLGQYRLIWSPVLTLAEAVEDESAAAFGSFPTVDHPVHGKFRTVAPPLRMSAHPLEGTAPAPEIGADGRDVLREAGLTNDEITSILGDA